MSNNIRTAKRFLLLLVAISAAIAAIFFLYSSLSSERSEPTIENCTVGYKVIDIGHCYRSGRNDVTCHLQLEGATWKVDPLNFPGGYISKGDQVYSCKRVLSSGVTYPMYCKNGMCR